MRFSALMLTCALVLVTFAPPAAAADRPAAISGSVVSKAGAGLPGAVVTITHRESGRSVIVTAGDRGVYRAGSLQPGTYDVAAELVEFNPASASLTLKPGEARTVDLKLAPSTLEESLTVTAAAPRDSLEATEIRESPARDVGEALSSTPGVWMLRKGGVANEVVLRGYQSRDLNVLIDGERIYGACPNHMDPPAFHVDFSEVDRIDVAKGPFDVQNQGSLGGVVNVVTRKPGNGLHVTPNMAAGSWGYVNPSATLSYGNDAFSFLAGYSYRSSGPYKDGSGALFTERANYLPTATEEDAFRVGTAWARTTFKPAKGHSIQASYTRQESDDIYYPYLMMDAVYDDTDRAHLSYEWGGAGALDSLSAHAYFTRVQHWMTDEFRTSSADPNFARDYSMGSQAETQTGGGRIEAKVRRTTLGVEVSRRSWDVATYMAGMGYAPQYSVPGVAVKFAGLYAETSLPLGERWTFNAGARYDWADGAADENRAPTNLYYAYNDTRSTSRTDSYPSGNVRFVWRDGGGVEFGAGIGHTARVPEPNERYFGLKRKGSDWVGDPDLDPSRNTGLDLSVSVRRSGFYLGASLFGDSVHDYITVHGQPRIHAVPGVMNTIARSYVNNDATLWGGEVSAAVPVTKRLSFASELSYVRGMQDTDPAIGITSKNLAEMPPLRFRSSMRFNSPRWWVEAEGVFAAAQDNVDTELLEETTPGWGIANLKGGVYWRDLALTIGVSNVFDRLYAEHLSYQRDPYRSGVRVYEPGRSIFCNIGYRF